MTKRVKEVRLTQEDRYDRWVISTENVRKLSNQEHTTERYILFQTWGGGVCEIGIYHKSLVY